MKTLPQLEDDLAARRQGYPALVLQEKAIAAWVQHYNHERYHESLDNVTPSDVCLGHHDNILDQRAIIKSPTMTLRKVQNLRLAG